ncbi:hypothetical protein FNV43_RR21221 [Rhamnella rubrinervis]|uniref:Uncharacterized protein n=1 Tax=Rhamnella rubrinervis TaxID=2594499 RepID=A0A8K0GU64_9ROSA|nr:hypothetical protein FNV43_RR21221 [Rhamnella rubrinervis]
MRAASHGSIRSDSPQESAVSPRVHPTLRFHHSSEVHRRCGVRCRRTGQSLPTSSRPGSPRGPPAGPPPLQAYPAAHEAHPGPTRLRPNPPGDNRAMGPQPINWLRNQGFSPKKVESGPPTHKCQAR